ncbi:hypothetical protein EVJ58_g3939 [Rhodofomes roseus]|uniref:Uncharacterized protein n=1 Tax=Rhodofomes roseus TaxID=34475 RepID=A0A4Y9YIF7_9APHY|nr:hypothetical protein EVJ58_g3939 [Rhodofomes roseus]
MQFNIKIAALLAVLVAPHALGQTLYSISYDTSYDTASTPTASAMCGSQLTSEGYATYGSIPTFPSLGGSANITGPRLRAVQPMRRLRVRGELRWRKADQLGRGLGLGLRHLGGGDEHVDE